MRDGHENTVKPLVVYYRCARCCSRFLTYADVPDVEGLCLHLAERWLQARSLHDYGDVRSVDRSDLHSAMLVCAWELYLEWQAERGVPFRAYAAGLLVKRGAIEWDRQQRGRSNPKPLSVAFSLDAPLRPHAGEGGSDEGQEDAASRYDTLGWGDRLGGAAAEGAGSVRAHSDAALRRAFTEGSRIAASRGGRHRLDPGRGGKVGVGGAQLPAEGGHGTGR